MAYTNDRSLSLDDPLDDDDFGSIWIEDDPVVTLRNQVSWQDNEDPWEKAATVESTTHLFDRVEDLDA